MLCSEICYLQYKQYVNCENIWNPFPFLHSVEKEIFKKRLLDLPKILYVTKIKTICFLLYSYWFFSSVIQDDEDSISELMADKDKKSRFKLEKVGQVRR